MNAYSPTQTLQFTVCRHRFLATILPVTGTVINSRLSLMRKPASLSRVKRPRRCLPRLCPHAGTPHTPCLGGGIHLATPDLTVLRQFDIKLR